MCGIFGFYLNRALKDDDLKLGQQGLAMLRHRGPDGEGVWYDRKAGVFLAHARLAILDTSSMADQPMSDDGRVLCWNGELYNYQEIRNKLTRIGCKFRSTGDTEVALKSWAVWGACALEQFDGMFACALYDHDVLNLISDPFGEKPMFWAQMEDGIYFASEAQVLIHLLGLRYEPTEEEVAAFMSLGFLPPPATGYGNLFIMPPATHFVVKNGKTVSSHAYWTPPSPQVEKGKVEALKEEQLDQIHDVILTSLTRRVRSDVSLGLFLSGGVDSALIAAILAKDLDCDITAYTVAFPDGVDESKAARRIADHVGLRHCVINSLEGRIGGGVDEQMKDIYGVPNDNLTALSVYQMSLLAREHITVALSGLGGDEIFYGYSKYSFLYRNRVAYRYLAPVMDFTEMFDRLCNAWPYWRIASRMLRGGRIWQFLSLKNSGLGVALRKLPGGKALVDSLNYTTLNKPDLELAFGVRDFDMNYTLPGSYIPAVDRGSMRASLEVRTPFLSRDLLEVVSKFDQRTMLAFGQKYVLRQILHRYIPEDKLDSRKRGFVYPAERYLKEASREVPDVPWVPADLARQIWEGRSKSDYRGLAVRLDLLRFFMQGNVS